LVLVKGDLRKESQFNPTKHYIMRWYKGIAEWGYWSTKLWEDQCWKYSFIYLYNTYYAKALLRKHCKEGGNCCNPFFGPCTKKIKIQKKSKKIYKQKNRTVKKDVRMFRKWSKIGWGGLKIQKLKFNNILLTDESLVDKENSILRKKSPKSCVYGLN